MRKSRDEEVIAYILTYILLGQKIEPTVRTLDLLYTYDELQINEEDISAKINAEIEKRGFDNIIQDFLTVHDFLSSLLIRSGKNFHDILFDKKVAKGLVRSYQIVFLSLYRLLVDENMECADEDALIDELKHVGTDQLSNVAVKDFPANVNFRITA